MGKQLIGVGIVGLLLAGFFVLRSHYQSAGDRGTATPQSDASALVISVPEQTLYKAAHSRYQPSALTHEFETAADLGAFYQRYASREPSGEQLYFLQQALRKCTDFLDDAALPRLATNDPLYEQRSAALLALSERCRGFQGFNADAIKAARLVLKERAAASDHPRVQAEHLMWAFATTPRADLFKKANELARTRDPYVLLHISVLYEMTGRSGEEVRLGASRETISGRTAATAWHLVACDYGLDTVAAVRRASMTMHSATA